jgi:hypothetical protein
MYILVIIKGYFGIPGVISPKLAPEAVGDSQSRAQASTKYTKVPTHILIKMICWLLWTISEYYCAFFGYIDTLSFELFASWATLPLGLASWACLLGYFNMLPLGPCLIDIVCFDNAGILICLLGCAITRHLLVCKNDKIC